jgi:hypothetical protein
VFRSKTMGCAPKSNKWLQNFDLKISGKEALGK